MPKKILVADDEHYMHRVMQYHLGKAGYDVITATNGRDAVAKTQHDQPDLVLMDVMMREMDGLEALRELKQSEATRGIPVILMTASAQISRQHAEEYGAAGFFSKPFSPARVLREINRVLLEVGQQRGVSSGDE
jgi:two-component system, OmpR family, alkaline phosphatase synthesis response regulator PhoP